jgi:hypothetical protein
MNKSMLKKALAIGVLVASFFFANIASAATGTGTSINWAGYAVDEGSYSGVSGTFTMPELSYSSTMSSNATWVGIGGRTSDDLIQAGVYEIADANGATYQAWYELLPDNATSVNLAVHPNDSISIAIVETSTDTWNIVITNNTTKQQFAKTVQYHSSHSSAEWIQERPQVNGAFSLLSGFTPIQFSGATAVQNGQRLALGQMNPQIINLLDTASGAALAVPEPIAANGLSFNVFRTSAIASTITTTPAQIQQSAVDPSRYPIYPWVPGIRWVFHFR